MIQPGFQNFFLAMAGASAALIGLLFVAVSVAPEKVVGPNPLAVHQVRAVLALTAFASTLTLSLIALMPDAHIGWPATLLGATGMILCLTSFQEIRAEAHRARWHAAILLLSFFLVMLLLMVSGVRLIVDPRDLDPVSSAGIATIALLAIGITRSWELVGGRSRGIAGLAGRLSAELPPLEVGSDFPAQPAPPLH